MAGAGSTVLAVFGRSDRRLSEALRLRVPGEVPPAPGGLLGLELEFSVRSAQGGQVHFGSLIHRLALDGTALDPSDPNAYRCSWGGVITSDGAEAEVATPPVRTRPGFIAQLQGWARSGEAELRRAMPRGMALDGYSAHFSAAMPAKLNDRVCQLYAETFAADLMLLMDRIDSPGLLLRPRPGRTELCGEFTQDQALAAAAAFVAGTTRACAAAVRRRSERAALPPRLDVRLARAVHRYGWYVDRRAFGPDLHAASRRTLLPRASGGTIRAQSHLELAWAAARQALADDAAASDLHAADAMISGALPLPAEQRQPDDVPGAQRGWVARFPAVGTTGPATSRLCAHVRPGFTLRPVAATWDFTVFEVSGPARRAYACIPRDSLAGFLAALEEGVLDDAIAAYLALTSRRRVLSAPEQTRRPGLYDQMGAPARLLAPERDPRTGRRESGEQGAKRTLVRLGKRNRQDQEVPKETTRFVSRAAAIGVAAAIVLAAAGAATALSINAHRGPQGQPAAVVSLQPSALSFPAVRVNASVTKSITLTNNGGSPATITGMSIGGSSLHDFSVVAPSLLDAAYRGGQAVSPAAQPPPCHRSIPHAQSCAITVTFTPSASGPRTADLRIGLASPLQPQDIALSGTGTIAPPSSVPPSSSVSVIGVAPSSGPAGGGTSVVITGGGFTGATGVSFGGTAATSFTVDSAGQITATSPSGTGTVDITVTTPAGTSATTAADQFAYTVTRPNVTGVAPSSGAVGGGTSVVITGGGFTGATGVSFGGTAATSFTVDSAGQITATSPSGTGTVDITVTTRAGTSATTTADQFSYVAPPAVLFLKPSDGFTTGGVTVTVVGRGFTGAVGVYFGSVKAPAFAVISDREITTTSPPSASPGAVDVTVVTAGGPSAPTSDDQFRYITPPPPAVTGIKPTGGKPAGGITVTIIGRGFTGATAVDFGGTPAAFTVNSDTVITATSPAGSGTVDITVTTPAGTSAAVIADQFTYA